LRFLKRGLVCVAIVQNGRESRNATELLTGKVARLGVGEGEMIRAKKG
jgi:hypothetical protein